MADNTDTSLQTPATTEATTAAPSTGEGNDGAFAAGTTTQTAPAADKAEQMRRAAFAKATGKGQPGAPASDPQAEGSPDSSTPDAGEPEETDEGEGEGFDQDNGLDAKGKPVKGERQTPAKGDAEASPSSKTPAEQAPTSPEERERLVVAKRALRLSGLDDADLAALPTARILALGQQAAERNRKVNAALRDAADIRKNAARGGNPGDGDSTDTATGARERRAPKTDRIDALIDELEGRAVEPEPEEGEEPAAKPDPALEAIRKERDSARAELTARNIQDGISELMGDFPQLRGKDAKQALYEAMDRLDPDAKAMGNRDELFKLMRDAAYIAIGPVITARAKEERQSRANKERNGQVDTGGDTVRPPKKQISAEEKRRAAYESSKTPSREEARSNYTAKVRKMSGASA